MLLSDRQITVYVNTGKLIEPFYPKQLNPYGYDLILDTHFLVPVPDYRRHSIIDPMAIENTRFEETVGPHCIIPPNSFVLGTSIEYIRMPSILTGMCVGRSTYARCGIITNVTPLEAGWEGQVTIEISNTAPLPAKVYAHKGIIQVLFFEGNVRPRHSYTGKYQGQTEITLPKRL